MQVDPAAARNCQQPSGNDLSVGNNDYGVGRDAFQKFLRRIRLDGLGLKNVQIGRERRLFYGRAAYILPPPARPVRLGDDGFDGNAWLGGKAPERGYGKFRRATKDDAHGGHPRGTDYHSPVFRNLRIRRLIRSLLSMLRCWMKRMPFR